MEETLKLIEQSSFYGETREEIMKGLNLTLFSVDHENAFDRGLFKANLSRKAQQFKKTGKLPIDPNLNADHRISISIS